MKTKTVLSVLALLAIAFTLIPSPCLPAVPSLINYQGVLKDSSGAPYHGNATVVFSLYDAESDGNKKWEEIHVTVFVNHGLFSVLLGSVTPIDLDFAEDYWLDVIVNGTQLSPRRRIASVGYAFRSAVADTADLALTDNDWVMDGDDVYREQGRVGIGTSSPEYELDVAGTARFEGLHMPTGAADGNILTSDSSGAGTWQPPGTVFGCLKYITSDTAQAYTTAEDWTNMRSYTIPAGAVSQGIIVMYNNRTRPGGNSGPSSITWRTHIRITANSVTKGASQSWGRNQPGGGYHMEGLTKTQYLAITDLDWDTEQTINLDMKCVKDHPEYDPGNGYNDSWLILGF